MKRSTIIGIHLIFWTVMLALIFAIFYYVLMRESHSLFNPFLHTETLYLAIVPFTYLLFPFYFSYYYFTNKIVQNGLRINSLISLILFILYFTVLLRIQLVSFSDNPGIIWLSYFSLSVILTFIIGGLGSLFNIIEKWYANEKLKVELQRKNLRIELDLLKLRMNPHFLFNTINNIDVLIEDDPKKASQYLQKLSGILRFVLFKADTAAIFLQDEIQNINDYLELQKIRTLNKNYINFEVKGNVGNRIIAPLLFIPYIENAFKYANNKKIKNAISIKLDVSKSQIAFTCDNYFDINKTSVEEMGGLGNELMKQRLDLLYKNKYNLKINQEENRYIVELKIETDDN